jgi:hypothetical protein
MANLMALGLIAIFMGGVAYLSWTRPKRPYPPTGYALGTIRGAQVLIGLGVLLFVLGLIGTVIKWIF